MSSLSPTPDSRKKNLQGKTNYPQKERLKNLESVNSSLLLTLPNSDLIPKSPTTMEVFPTEDKQIMQINQKLVAQNGFLRKQIKELNIKLSELIVTLPRKSKERWEPSPPSDNVLRKQLENAYKQIEHYKKEIHMLTENAEINELVERIKKLEDLNLEKDLNIEKLVNEKKAVERIKRGQEKDLENYQESLGYEKQLSLYHEEVQCLRDKIGNMIAVNRHNESNFRKQQGHLVDMTIQYRLVCEKIGIPPNKTFRTVKELDQIMKNQRKPVKKNKLENQENSNREIELDFSKAEAPKSSRSQSVMKRHHARVLSSAGLKNMEEKYPSKKELLSEDEEKYKKDIQALQMKVYMLENEKRILKAKAPSQEQNSINIRNSTVREKRTMIKRGSLSRINLLKNPESNITSQRNSVNYGSMPSDDESSDINQPKIVKNIEQKKGEAINLSVQEEIIEAKITKGNAILPSSRSSLQSKSKVIDLKSDTLKQSSQLDKETQKVIEDLNTSFLKKPILTKKKVVVGKVEPLLLQFNDNESVHNPFSSKITQLTVWSDSNFISGIQAFYSFQDAFNIFGKEHIKPEMKVKAKEVSCLEIEDDDKICNISGKYSEGIIYLKIKTKKGVIKEFGKNRDFGESFEIEVEPNEELTLLNGAFKEIKGDKDNENQEIFILANIGFTLIKETKR